MAGGGNFVAHNKILPGAYINTVSAKRGFMRTPKGVVAMPLVLSWGEESKILRITRDEFWDESESLLGGRTDDARLAAISEAFKNAQEVIIYRVNKGGVKATRTLGGLTCTAVHTGDAGNKISVAIQNSVDLEGYVDIITYFGNREADKVTVKANRSGDPLNGKNAFVSYSAAGTITAAVRSNLAGGADGIAAGEDYTKALKEFESQRFNVITYIGSDSTVKNVVTAFVKRLRTEDGIKVSGVLCGLTAPDSVGITDVQCEGGITLPDGAVVTEAHLCAWVAGAAAAADVKSYTNAKYEDARLNKPLTKKEQERAIKDGKFVFYQDGSAVRVLADINSLVTFEDGGATKDWTSNRVIRILDSFAMDVAKLFSENYIGIVTNDSTGRNLLKSSVIDLADVYQRLGAIRDFNPDDIEVKAGADKRDIEVSLGIIPTDAMEKMYMTVVVS